MCELTTLDSVDVSADGPPLEWLERQISELAGHLAAATCRFLVLLGDFDAREGWRAWDLPSCSAWLSWKCQMSAGTAREHVRVARAMRALPVIRGEFAAGRMSFAKVRALTRIATAATDADLAEMAGPMTASQLERFARAHRHVSKLEAGPAEAERRLRWRLDDDGSLVLSVRLPPADGAVVLQALRASARDLESVGEEAAARTSLADALVGISGAYLAGKIATASNPDIYQVIVHVGTDVLTDPADVSAETPPGAPSPDERVGHPANPRRCHVEDGPALHPGTVRRMACQATLSWMLHDHDGTLLDVGRRHRVPPPALRRAVRERDGYRCRFPGCRSRRVEIHHLQPWSKGGPTSLWNLILFCKCHHTIVHELGYLITLGEDGEITVTRPDGSDLPSGPQLESSGADIAGCHDADITPDTIVACGYGDGLNLDLAIWASFANASLRAREPGVTLET
jgi:5-methylcytosine-specific restriction endonuclease McrA